MEKGLFRGAALVVPVLAGLTTSALLLVDYLRPVPVFCAEGGGCDAVKRTVMAYPFGVPLPVFGVLGFAVLGVLVLARGPRARTLHALVALAGAVMSVWLLIVQLLVGQFCPYCTIVDVSACLACGVACWRCRQGWDFEPVRAGRAGIIAALAGFPAIVLAFGLTAKVRLPEVIADEMNRAPKGQATIVEFVDFECPFCRDEYDDLAPILASMKDHVRVVRKLVPLTKIHPHAMEAARAACCADLQGKGEVMAEALFHAPVEELTQDGCKRIASELGLDPDRYSACLADPKTNDRIALDRQTFDRAASKGDGLPLLWIGERKVMGLHDPSDLRRALDAAIAKAGS